MSTPRDDERRLTLAPEPAEPSGLAPVVGQMLFMPLTMMMYGLNLLARTARGASNGGAPPAGRRPAPVTEARAYAEPGSDGSPPQVAPPSGWSTLQPGWRRPNLELVRGEGSQQTHHQEQRNSEGHEPRGSEEQRSMVDNKNLQDDMLKTVRYWISFEKRDYEAVLHDGIDHVYDNLTDAQFTAWKMAEFMQLLKSDTVAIPFAWKGKKVSFFTADAGGQHVSDFDHSDKKYLTVDWEVVGRVVRRKGRFDERKTEALETIADKLNCDGTLMGTIAGPKP
jgi:hypothetical protein